MSKVDAQRAMREAKYARDSASGPTRREAAARAGTAAAPAARTAAEQPAPPTTPAPPATAAVGLCGHKSMNGRTCTREAAHPEKNHRYS